MTNRRSFGSHAFRLRRLVIGGGLTILFALAIFKTDAPRSHVAARASTSAQACSYSIAPTSQLFDFRAATGRVTVTTTANCNWTAVTNADWLSVTAGNTGAGTGTVNYSVAAYTGLTTRTGTLTIAGQTFTVTQGFICPVAPLTFGQTVSGTLITGDCTSPLSTNALADRYSFTGAAGMGVTIALSGVTNFLGASLHLLGPDGTRLAQASTPTPGGASIPSSGFFNLPAGGLYTVEVASSGGGGYSLTLYEGTPGCSYTVTPASQTFTPLANQGSLTVTAGAGCVSNVYNTTSWLTITPGQLTGPGTLNYTVAANTSPTVRFGGARIGDKAFSVTQYGDASGCQVMPITLGQTINGALTTSDCRSPISYFRSIPPFPDVIPYADRYSFNAVAGDGIAISMQGPASVFSFSSYILLLDPNGDVLATSGTNSVNARLPGSGFLRLPASGRYTIEASAYSGPASSAALTGNYLLNLSGGTAGCNYSLASASSAPHPAVGGTGSVMLNTDTNCAWTANSEVSWITLPATSGTGGKAVSYTVAPNPDSRLRTGTLRVASLVYTVTQYGNDSGCTVTPLSFGQVVQGTISPTDCPSPLGLGNNVDRYSFDATAGAGVAVLIHRIAFFTHTLSLLAPSGELLATRSLSPTTPPNSDFRLPADGFLNLPLTGRYIVEISIPIGSSSVNYTLSLNAGTSGCSYAFTDNRGPAALHTGGNGSLAVTTGNNCVWTAHSESNWITVTSGASGTGNGAASYTTAPNPSPTPRFGLLRVAAQLRDVMQFGNPGGCVVTQISAGQTLNGTLATSDCRSPIIQTFIGTVPNTHYAKRYSFKATAGEEFSLAYQASTLPATLSLLGPEGLVIASAPTNSNAPYNARIPVTGLFKVPATGSYLIEVTSSGFSSTPTGAFTLSLSGCLYNLAMSSQVFNAAGGAGSVSLSVPAGCAWTASSNAAWLTLASPASGAGNSTFNFTVEPNTGSAARTGALTIANQSFAVLQSGVHVAPTLTALSPSAAAVGGREFILTVDGASFVPGAVVRWNGGDRVTTYVSETRLTAAIPASDLATGGVAQVTVFNPAPGGGASAPLSFNINRLAPRATALSPNLAAAGGPGFPLTVTGADFSSDSVVRWNGGDRATTFITASQLRAAITAADIATAGTAQVTVFTPAPGGGTTTALNFIVAPTVTGVSAASFLGQEIAAESMMAAFGVNLATATETATSVPLPTSLRGTVVEIRDSAGVVRRAPLFFVSPAQINCQLPAGAATGTAMVTVTAGDGKLSLGALQVAAVAPGLFTANSSGQGVVAAVVLRVKADGSQSFEAVAQFDPVQQRYVALPIDLGPQGEQVFLILYGTGVRGRMALSNVAATLGGLNAEVLYAGAQGGFVGLDQINLRLPRSLAGRGEVDVALTVDGKTANLVKVSIK